MRTVQLHPFSLFATSGLVLVALRCNEVRERD
jgi:hypothetical protein